MSISVAVMPTNGNNGNTPNSSMSIGRWTRQTTASLMLKHSYFCIAPSDYSKNVPGDNSMKISLLLYPATCMPRHRFVYCYRLQSRRDTYLDCLRQWHASVV